MLTPTMKSQIRQLWDKFWSGGISNPLTAIEQISYLLFMRRLDEMDLTKKADAEWTGEPYQSMFEGEFTHEGDLCSFEVLVQRFAGQDKALAQIGKIVHDLDLKESKFKKPETAGISALLDGIVAAHKSDEARLDRGSALFDNLYEFFRRK